MPSVRAVPQRGDERGRGGAAMNRRCGTTEAPLAPRRGAGARAPAYRSSQLAGMARRVVAAADEPLAALHAARRPEGPRPFAPPPAAAAAATTTASRPRSAPRAGSARRRAAAEAGVRRGGAAAAAVRDRRGAGRRRAPTSCLFGRRRAACVVYAELVVTTKPPHALLHCGPLEWLVELLPQFFAPRGRRSPPAKRRQAASAKGRGSCPKNRRGVILWWIPEREMGGNRTSRSRVRRPHCYWPALVALPVRRARARNKKT